MDLVEVEKMIAEVVSRLEYALENCRLYAARHRKEEWAQHILRFCADAEVVGSPTRETSAASFDKEQIDYPRDVFNALIDGNSPYAFYLFQWVPYQTDAKRWRLKMCHDVRTFDGREAHGIWPNGDHCGPFRDDEVEFIRISKKQHGIEWQDPRLPHNAKVSGGEAVRLDDVLGTEG